MANLVAKNEALARLHLALGQKDKAIERYEDLLMINSSNQKYYYDILKVHGFTQKSGSYTSDEEAKIDEILSHYE